MMRTLIDGDPGNEGEERIVIMRLCSCTTGMSYRSELVPFPASYEVSLFRRNVIHGNSISTL